jgi:hypothetical protein
VSVVPTSDVMQAEACDITTANLGESASARSMSWSAQSTRWSVFVVLLGLLPPASLVLLMGHPPWP